ncbi:MAG: excinuclease ABC subunit UvrA [Bacteroidota bacterium]
MADSIPGTASRPGPGDKIMIRGAREHNLKNIDADIPRDRLVVITGLSGSGKSSLAFDTVYAEGQRRFVESLSAYARQFLDVMERPEVESMEGLSPAIAIQQQAVAQNPRSTVGTVTEIYDYLRLLFARTGVQECHRCGRTVLKQTADQIVDRLMELPPGTRMQILAPVVRGRKGRYRELFEEILRDGFVRVRVDGTVQEIRKGMQLDRYRIHDVEIVVDRLAVRSDLRARIADSVDVALRFGSGVVLVQTGDEEPHAPGGARPPGGANTPLLMSRHLWCPACGLSFEEPTPASFSFNSPYGACPSCTGLGERKEFSLDLILPDPSLSIREGALAPLGKPRPTWAFSQIRAAGRRYGFDFDTPLKKLTKKARGALLYGTGEEKLEVEYRFASGRTATYRHRFGGLLDILKHQYEEARTGSVREWVESYMSAAPCAECGGGRLRQESLAIRLMDAGTGQRYAIRDIVGMSLGQAGEFFRRLRLEDRRAVIARPILKEIRERLAFLVDVGLEYLTLDRPARTLSGGEGQRIRLATQIGSQLVGVLYILDEPSIGLHQRDNIKLIRSLKRLRDMGNTVIVVEHDREMIESADFVLDLGPGAGAYGGYVVAAGSPRALPRRNDALPPVGHGFEPVSYTAQYLSRERSIPVPEHRRPPGKRRLILVGASGNNLKDVTLRLPLGTLVAITGVSGSGKSSLITETLYPALARGLSRTRELPLAYRKISGADQVDKVIRIDQSPIGRTPRSNPATYTGLFTLIRDLFARMPEAGIRGYRAGRFSFNVAGGRCEGCEGDGVKRIEMNFLPDVYVVCDVCRGKRYNRETLQVLYRGKSVADVLEMTVREASEFFSEIPRLCAKLRTLRDVGLGYIRLGQQATTLSGGEAQRVKLSAELSRTASGRTLYILDEPTTGLHFEDIRVLLELLNRLVTRGSTVVVIEHNLDVIKAADWIVDLGPGAGEAGGRIVAQGTPEEVSRTEGSCTGEFLRRELTRSSAASA